LLPHPQTGGSATAVISLFVMIAALPDALGHPASGDFVFRACGKTLSAGRNQDALHSGVGRAARRRRAT
jgi:hypothetical protein